MSGRSMTNDCLRAAHNSAGSNRLARRLWRRASLPTTSGAGLVSVGIMVWLMKVVRRLSRLRLALARSHASAKRRITYALKRDRSQVFRDRAKDGGRQKQQR